MYLVRFVSQAGTANGEDAHLSGDSIPIGCEASHLEARLDSSLDSGLASLTRDPLPHPPLPAMSQVGGGGVLLGYLFL